MTFFARPVRLAAIALAVAGLAFGSGALQSRPASAAEAPRVSARFLSGSAIVNDFDDTTYRIRVTNESSQTVNDINVTIRGLETPLDFKSIAIDGATRGFICNVTESLAIFGADARCKSGDLTAGQSVTIELRAETGIVPLSGVGELAVSVSQPFGGSRPTTFSVNRVIHFF